VVAFDTLAVMAAVGLIDFAYASDRAAVFLLLRLAVEVAVVSVLQWPRYESFLDWFYC
jgi:hypothetical protein